MNQNRWPDELTATAPQHVQSLLSEFWHTLARLPDLLLRQEFLLCHENMTQLRNIVIEMMLALNGILKPDATRHLNSYLSASQRTAIEKTLLAPTVDIDTWIGQAVALVVIYQWYAPQLVDKLSIHYPYQLENEIWAELVSELPSWPRTVTSG